MVENGVDTVKEPCTTGHLEHEHLLFELETSDSSSVGLVLRYSFADFVARCPASVSISCSIYGVICYLDESRAACAIPDVVTCFKSSHSRLGRPLCNATLL